MSPKFLDEDGFSFKIYSNEEDRMHIHVMKDDKEAKFWLEPEVEMAENFGYSKKDLKKIANIVLAYAEEFKKKYREHIG